MNKDILNGNWKELKGKIQKVWGRLTDDDLKKVEGNMNELSGRLQKVYGYTKEEATAEIDSFKQQFSDSSKTQHNSRDQKPPTFY